MDPAMEEFAVRQAQKKEEILWKLAHLIENGDAHTPMQLGVKLGTLLHMLRMTDPIGYKEYVRKGAPLTD